nr:urease accessory protein UreD [Collinsella urealyticum]
MKRLEHDGRLSIVFDKVAGRTVIADSFQIPPLNVMRPLYVSGHDRGEATVILMDSSGGLLPGNTNEIRLSTKPGVRARLRPQAATLIHPSFDGGISSQYITIDVADESSFMWEPEVTIPYTGSRYKTDVEVHLEKNSYFSWGDILAPGRLHKDERFEYETLLSRMRIYREGELIAFDSLRLDPADHDLTRLGVLDGADYIATMWFAIPSVYSVDVEALAAPIEAAAGLVTGGISEIEEGLYLIRLLGSDLVALRALMAEVGRIALGQ